MFIPPPHTQASALAIELGNKIAAMVQEFRQTHPGTSDTDVRSAFRVASMQTGAGATKQMVAGLLAGLLVALGLALFFFRAGSTPGATPPGMLVWIIAAFVVVAIIVRMAARR
jgi:hypothetical protein